MPLSPKRGSAAVTNSRWRAAPGALIAMHAIIQLVALGLERLA